MVINQGHFIMKTSIIYWNHHHNYEHGILIYCMATVLINTQI